MKPETSTMYSMYFFIYFYFYLCYLSVSFHIFHIFYFFPINANCNSFLKIDLPDQLFTLMNIEVPLITKSKISIRFPCQNIIV